MALAASWNFLFYIYPNSTPAGSPPLQFALEQRERWPPGTAVAFTTFHPDLWTISYFNPQVSWIGIARANVSSMENYHRQVSASGNAMWIEASAYDDLIKQPEGRRWIETFADSRASLSYSTPKQNYRFYKLLPRQP